MRKITITKSHINKQGQQVWIWRMDGTYIFEFIADLQNHDLAYLSKYDIVDYEKYRNKDN